MSIYKRPINEYLRNDLLKSIENDLYLPLKYHEIEDRGGFFSISRTVLCYIEFLGRIIADGRNITDADKSIHYINQYLGNVNPLYKIYGVIIWHMWRHGLVHEYDPKVFINTEKKYTFGWGANNTSKECNRKWHLHCLVENNKPDCYTLWINLFQLVDDLCASIELLIKRASSNEEMLNKMQSNFDCISQNYDITNKPQLCTEIENAISKISGVVNYKGSVIAELNTKEDIINFRKYGKIRSIEQSSTNAASTKSS